MILENNRLSYEKAGVNIEVADETKKDMIKSIETDNSRVLNKLGAFASLFDGSFPAMQHPVLVLKTEEPGSKQKIAFEHNHIKSICYDMINHLVNDIIVMGAQPLAVQDAIICGKLEKEVVKKIVSSISEACIMNGCVLTGGETSEQPGVIEKGMYILTSSIVGVVDKDKVIDGSKIQEGDLVLAVASNGIHTNGYSLVRALMSNKPKIINHEIDDKKFLDIILEPHKSYYKELKDLFELEDLHGMAHITGGGIQGNLHRILPEKYSASIELGKINILPIFKLIRKEGNISDSDMLKTFNMGVGMILVIKASSRNRIIEHLQQFNCDSYIIGKIHEGNKEVVLNGNLTWD